MIRLDRWLVTLGIGSRSQVQRMIRTGRVAVEDCICRDPGEQVEDKSSLVIDGIPRDGRLTRHVLLDKPAGLLTAARDKKQPTVMDLLPPVYAAIGCMPVGRLDKDTTGLLLLTTDGELSHRLLAPARHVDKTYRAEVSGQLDEHSQAAFADGMDLDNFVAAPAVLTILDAGQEASVGMVTLHEGKFHQVKRMFEKVGCPVTSLRRLRFGPLILEKDSQPGQWRELTGEETVALYAAAQMEVSE